MGNEYNQAELEKITETKHQILIESTVRAIEGYVQLSCISLGILQIISLMFSGIISNKKLRFMRTISNITPSEATVAAYLRKNIIMLFRFFTELPITAIIKARQELPEDNIEYSTA